MAEHDSDRDDRIDSPEPQLVWYASAIHTLMEQIDSLGSIRNQPDADPQALIASEVDSSSRLVITYWRSFCDILKRREPGMAQAFLDKRVLPSLIESAADGALLLQWPKPDASTARFFDVGRLDVPALPFSARSPFEPVRLARLPEGTALLPITNEVHAATAAVTESLRAFLLDAREHVAAAPEAEQGALMRAQVDFYVRTSRLREQGLSDDEYRHWTRAVVDTDNVAEFSEAIVQSCSTAGAQRAVAFGMCARLYETLMGGENGAGHKAAQASRVLDKLTFYYTRIAAILDGYNHICVQSHGVAHHVEIDIHNMIMVPILRPIPAQLPNLALIPADAPDLSAVLSDSMLG